MVGNQKAGLWIIFGVKNDRVALLDLGFLSNEMGCEKILVFYLREVGIPQLCAADKNSILCHFK